MSNCCKKSFLSTVSAVWLSGKKMLQVIRLWFGRRYFASSIDSLLLAEDREEER